MDYTIDEIVTDLAGFVHWLANTKQSDTVLMEADEIVGELFEELVKGFQYYEKKQLTRPQMCAVLRRMMDNRISELVYKYYSTHRKQGNNAIDMDSLYEFNDEPGNNSNMYHVKSNIIIQASISIDGPERMLDSTERFRMTMERLSPDAKKVLEAIVNGNELLVINLQLAGERLSTVRKGNCEVKLKPWYVADSLGMSEEVAEACFEEIRKVYKEICIEYDK